MQSEAFSRGHRALVHGLFATLLWVSALGCDRNIEPYQPGEEPSAPDLARIFPAPAGPVGAADGAGAGAGDGGGVVREAVPPSRAEGTRTGVAAVSAPIRGEIELDPGLATARPDGGVLFVIARPQGATAGPPLAVLRIPSPDFPLAFFRYHKLSTHRWYPES